MHIKNKAREIRKSLDKKLHDVAVVIDVYSRRIGRLEEQKIMPRLVKEYYKLCVAYDVEIEDFFPEETKLIQDFIAARKQDFKHRWS